MNREEIAEALARGFWHKACEKLAMLETEVSLISGEGWTQFLSESRRVLDALLAETKGRGSAEDELTRVRVALEWIAWRAKDTRITWVAIEALKGAVFDPPLNPKPSVLIAPPSAPSATRRRSDRCHTQ